MTETQTVDADGFVLAYRSPDESTEVWHLDGVAWADAPLPRRFHRCRPQTKGTTGFFIRVQRCACGAYRDNYLIWIRRNERRHG